MAKKKVKAKRAPRSKKASSRRPARAARRSMAAPRADYGKPIDGFIRKRPPEQRAILEALRKIVEKEAPELAPALKWGQPVYSLGTKMVIALGAHKEHVNLVLVGPASTFSDPDGLLTGSSKRGRHMTLRSVGDLPATSVVRGWIRQAAANARR